MNLEGSDISEEFDGNENHDDPQLYKNTYVAKMFSKLENSNRQERIHILTEIAHHYVHQSEFSKAITYFESALDLSKSDSSLVAIEDVGRMHAGLSYIYWKIKQFDKAYNEARKGIELLEEVKSEYLANAQRNLAVILIGKSRFSQSIELFKTIQAREFLDDEVDLATDNYYIGIAQIGLGLFSEAIQNIYVAHRTFENHHMIWMNMLCNQQLATCFWKIGNIDSALFHGRKSFETAIFLEAFDLVVEISILKSQIYAQMGDHEQAIFQLQAGKRIYLRNQEQPSFQDLHKLEIQTAQIYEDFNMPKKAAVIRRRLSVMESQMDFD